jgi:hypothetical protein
MKRLFWVVGLAAMLATIPAARAADATGTWKGSVDVNGGNMPLVFHLKVAGGVLTGTVEGMPTTPAQIQDGKADADGITFSVTTNYQGQPYKLICKGKISPAGDEIAFSLGTDDGSWSSQMTAERVRGEAPAAASAQVDATGTWKGTIDVNGGNMPLVFHLKVAGGVVTGTVEGMPTTPAEIQDGKAGADGITFSVTTNYQGQAYKLICKGKIAPAGDAIAFSIGTDDGSWSSQMTVEKQGTGSSQ